MKTRLIAGNWKMHKTAAQAVEFVHEFRAALPSSPGVDVLIAPPFISLSAVHNVMTPADQFALGAQNLHWESEGAFTGEVSGPMLHALGCSFVIVGHSERRQLFRESNEEINKKVKAALEHHLLPILCVGETLEEREAGHTQAIVKEQMTKGLAGVDKKHLSQVTLAYEPVWAIGTGRAASVEQAEEVHAFLRSNITNEGGQAAHDVRILYGGSVSPQNAESLFASQEIDGALVGKACLDPASFATICRLASHGTD